MGSDPNQEEYIMSEQEKKVVEKLKDAIPKMNDFQKGYVLGMVEGSASKATSEETGNSKTKE